MKNQVVYSSMINPDIDKGKADPIKDIGGAIGVAASEVMVSGNVPVHFASQNFSISNTGVLFVGCDVVAGKINTTFHKNLLAFLRGIDPIHVKVVAVFSILNSGKKSARKEIASILEPKGIKVEEDELLIKPPFFLSRKPFPSPEILNDAKAFGTRIMTKYRDEAR